MLFLNTFFKLVWKFAFYVVLNYFVFDLRDVNQIFYAGISIYRQLLLEDDNV